MNQNKLASYLGFSIKSGEVVFGFDNLLETRKKIKLVIYCHTVNPKIEDKLFRLCEYKNWALVKIEKETLSELIGRENCKVMGLINKDLSKAVLSQEIKIILKGDF